MKYLKEIALIGTILACDAHMAHARELRTVGVSVGSLGNPYFLSLVKGATDAAHKINPNAQVSAVSSDYDLGKQSSQIDNFIASGVDLILLAAADPHAVSAAVGRAKAAGIAVVAVDVEADGADATIQTDNTQAGRVSCAFLASAIGGKGHVIIQNGPQTSSVIERVNGCKESLAKYPDITILSDNQNGKISRDGGMDVMMGYLTRYPDFQGLFTVSDPQAIGSDLAAHQLKRTGIVITSVDGSPDAVTALKADTLIAATASQSPAEQGTLGVQTGYDILNGKKPAQKVTLLAPQLVDRRNVAAYRGW
ncbi:periplasmic binding protein/LacI transcriptional regulator [Gluconacetobacter diazotrophicus PA1 5]|uniref:ABC transporter substrate-binding protein n=1 Tax=Gluconacetobacter diazotrophicus TaxID=33996 RepID=A0A7W4I8G2_GLUDI|nr:ABC transporter substrate-binding protein [Gluconacetobacter diazotrophicus]ACI52956.1 periplasmic binding protein/LacI transcriptional regulator [Gluconacetobacter diazotrophicus PA1 5]MBB2158226.1 ABC transporter substrate-binding protein [Gluconacetobacter diazotrophicus]TWB00094.1 monosaccharide ABC transporter substrate-binding protein (CUT2 family) [Gluconacetobacter diazotrophicus]